MATQPIEPRHNGHRMCGAKTRAGTPCKRAPMANGRCYLHGGPTPKGIASPHFKHGRRSKYLPQGLMKDFKEAMRDPELMSLRPDVALWDARIEELLRDITEHGETIANWTALELKLNEFERSRQTGDAEKAAKGLMALSQMIRSGAAQKDIWLELGKAMEAKRRLSETEARRMERERLVMTVEEGAILVSTLASIVLKYVTDRQILTLIQEDMARMLPAGTGGRRTIDQ